MKTRLLVIIVTYNAMEWIERCLTSIYRSTMIPDTFIIDNGSSDGTQEYIQKNWEQIIFIQNRHNSGFGQANNIGLQYAVDQSYDYVYLLNQDAWVEDTTFEKLIGQHIKHPEFGIISPIQIQANGRHLDKNFLHDVAARTIDSNLLEDLVLGQAEDIYQVTDVMAAHWLLSAECIRKVGGFSPSFQHYGEDNNYALRARYHNLKIGIVPAAKGIHDREQRKNSIDDPVFALNILFLKATGNIFKKIKWHDLLWKFVRLTFQHGTFRQYRFLFTHLANIRFILKNRKDSKQEGAFLNLYH